MKGIHNKIYYSLSAIIISIVLYTGCVEHSVNPFEDETGVFSFYGFVIEGESPNYVRIRDLNEPFLSENTVLDATVTFENMETGVSAVLRDSILNFGGNITHNFIIEEEIVHDTRYRLIAERSDGIIAESIAKTPAITEVQLNPDSRVPDSEAPVFCDTPIEITFKNVVEPEFIDMTFSIQFEGKVETGRLNFFIQEIEHAPDADEMTIVMSARNMLVEIFPPPPPDNPFFSPYSLSPLVGCDEMTDSEIRVQFRHFGPEWGAGKPFLRGAIDTETGDVINGLGLFGAFRDDEFSFTFVPKCDFFTC